MGKIIEVCFRPEDEYYKRASESKLTQWSYGHILRIIGLDLPDPVEIHFSLEEKNGEAPAQIGRTVDGVTEAEIPAFIMEGPAYIANDYYKAYAFIFVSDKDFGETVRKIEFNIRARSKPADWIPPEDKDMLGEIFDAIREKVDKTGHAPNKILGTDEDGNVVTKEQEEYEKYKLPVASEAILGGVKPVTKTEDMTQDVGVDKHGKLFVKPCDTKMDEDVLLKLAIKPTTDPATSLHIQDSAKYRVLDVSMSGKTEQATTTGAQLFDKTLLLNEGGVEQADGSIYAPQINVRFYTNESEEAGQYTMTLTAKKEDNTNPLCLLVRYTDGTEEYFISANTLSTEFKTVTYITNASKVVKKMYITFGTSGKYYIKDFMVNKGATALPYEEYTGGIPSPNAEFEQPVVHAGVYNAESGRYEVDVEVFNNNFWDEQWLNGYYDTTNGVYVNQTNTVCSKNFTRVFPNATYYVLASNGGYFNILEFDSNKNFLRLRQPSINSQYTASNDANYILFFMPSAYGNTYLNDISIGISLEYIPHESQKVTLTSLRELTKWDRLEKRDGVYGWVYKSVKYVFNGSMWLRYDTFNGFTLPNGLTEKSNRQEGYCNQAKVIPSNTSGTMAPPNGLWLGVSNNTALYLVNNDFYDDTLEDKGLANFKAHLNENPLEIWTYSDTSELIPVSDEEQAALEALETYYGVTNISNSEECEMSIQYVADTKLYVDNKILAIQSAVI